MTQHPPFTAMDGQPGELIDLRQWRLNQLPDENSDEDWDDDHAARPDPVGLHGQGRPRGRRPDPCIVVSAADVLEDDTAVIAP
jgi:hypothetical protein